MNIIPRSQIKIRPDRQRKEFDEAALVSLSQSIANVGLINPLVVEATPEGTFLIAGERRFRALELLSLTLSAFRHATQEVPVDHLPVIYFNDLSELQREEIELEENVQRQDLSWQERVAAIARLDALRKKQSPEHTTRETAAEVFGVLEADAAQTAATTRALVLAKAAQRDPEIASAKTEREAYKLLARKEERVRFEALALSSAQTPIHARHKIFQADCLDWMAREPDGKYQIILTDPPYGMGADTFGDAAGKLSGIEHHYDDSADGTRKLLAPWLEQSYRIAAENAFLFLWCDIDLFHWLRDQATLAGWKPHRTPFINVKREGGRVPWPSQGPRRCYEICLYAIKGNRPARGIVRDVFESTLSERNYGHGAQKPVEAYEYLLRMVAQPQDIALDTFAGTGTLLEAAENVGIQSVCVERDTAHFGIMTERLKNLGAKEAA